MTLCYGEEDFTDYNIPVSGNYIISQESSLLFGGNKVALEEYAFDVEVMDESLRKMICWIVESAIPDTPGCRFVRKKLMKDTVVISDEDFRDFANLSTEVVTRIRIKPETGTVAKGGLFTVEYLPVDSVLYSLVLASPVFTNKSQKEREDSFKDVAEEQQPTQIINVFTEKLPELLQLGGNATLGKGLVRVRMGR